MKKTIIRFCLSGAICTLLSGGALAQQSAPQDNMMMPDAQSNSAVSPFLSEPTTNENALMYQHEYGAAINKVPEHRWGIDPVSQASKQLAEQLTNGLNKNKVRRLPMAILPFRELESRQVTHPIGERLSENLIYQLEHLGYNLVDYRALSLTTTQKSDPGAESLGLLRSRSRLYFVVTGTYANQPDGIVINARVLDTTTRQVLASGQTHISKQRLEGTWPGYDPLKAQSDGMIIENGSGPVGGRR